jgi:hypothetical protein
MHLFVSFIHWVDWSKVFEVALGAVLAFIFGFFLQWWLVLRQERFQKDLLGQQNSFLEKMERDRATNDDKRHQEHLKTLDKIAADNRSHDSLQRFIDRSR